MPCGRPVRVRHLAVLTSVLVATAVGIPQPSRAAPPGDLLWREIEIIFDHRKNRAEAYVDWTYGWAASYVYSYRSAARIAASVWASPEGWRQNVVGTLRAFQHQTIAERVTQPETDAAELSRLIDRHVAGRLYVLQSRTLARLCATGAKDGCRATAGPRLRELAQAVQAQRLDPVGRAEETSALSTLLDISVEDQVDLLHAARPITTRILVFILRLTELASLVVLVSQALRRAYVPDTAITRAIIALLIAWGLDFAVLSIERYANKDGFLASLKGQIDARRPALDTFVRARIAGAETDFAARSEQINREFK